MEGKLAFYFKFGREHQKTIVGSCKSMRWSVLFLEINTHSYGTLNNL